MIQRDGPLVIAGTNAVLLRDGGHQGRAPSGRLAVLLLRLDLGGRSLVATTYDVGALPYGDKKRIVDRMIDTLSLR